MAFWRKSKRPSAGRHVVENWWGFGDGTAVVLERDPDLAAMVGGDHPEPPLTVSGRPAGSFSADPDGNRMVLLTVHLYHPDPAVRATAARLGVERGLRAVGFIDGLVDLAADEHPEPRATGARGLWTLLRDSHCERAVMVLRDEIRGHSSSFAGGADTSGLRLGRAAAVRALDLLVEEAPDEASRGALRALIDERVLIPERVPEASTAAVVFVEETQRSLHGGGRATYVVYRAPGRDEAVTFLKSRPVDKALHYIEVETPGATYGRDVKGIYEL